MVCGFGLNRAIPFLDCEMPKRFGRSANTPHRTSRRAEHMSAFHKAGALLLSTRDADLVSVAEIAKAAGKSVGSFYHRFADKDLFLRATIERTLRAAMEQADEVLDAHVRLTEAASKVIRAASEHMVGVLHGLNAGVIRTAIKRSQLEPGAFEPVLHHRAAVADRLVEALAPRTKKIDGLEQRIRTAVQVAHATLIDVLLHKAGPLRDGQASLPERLAQIMQATIGASDEDLPPRAIARSQNRLAEEKGGKKERARKARQFT